MTAQCPLADIPILAHSHDEVPLAIIQIFPLLKSSQSYQRHSSFLPAPLAKLHLLNQSNHVSIQWDNENDEDHGIMCDTLADNKCVRTQIASGTLFPKDLTRWSPNVVSRTAPIFIFPSQDPIDDVGIPCLVRGYSARYLNIGHSLKWRNFSLKDDVMCHVFPPLEVADIDMKSHTCDIDIMTQKNSFPSCHALKDNVSGWTNVSDLYNDKSLLLSFEKEVVEELTIRMKILLKRQIHIGTTSDTAECWFEKKNYRRRLRSLCHPHQEVDSPGSSVKEDFLLNSAALVVHDPIPGSGKTTLVAAISKHRLNCESLHIINAPFLLAKYGASGADCSLETLLHQITLSSAVQRKNICIILDHLETFVPPYYSQGRNNSDPAIPTLNSVSAYLSRLLHSIETKAMFPFPNKNPIYNTSNRLGYIYPVHLCLVGVITCEDDGGRKSVGSFTKSTVLDALGHNRFRLPNSTIKNRVDILKQLLQCKGMRMDYETERKLPTLLASTEFDKRIDFHRSMIQLQSISAKNKNVLSTKDLLCVWDIHKIDEKDELESDDKNIPTSDKFASVGGISQAKKALLDALAFDTRKRHILSRFGMSPPNGVLLYGPPGNGKTLLAKAISNMMRRNIGDYSHQNGLFISLSASDIVRSEVGKSEKLLVSAFEMAQKSAPAVIFIDEFQALFTSRDDENSFTKGSGRLGSVLLQCMDDLSKWSNIDRKVHPSEDDQQYKRVVILGATNTPWMVDKAFLRSGRFDRVVHVSLPDEADREAILRIHVNRMRLDKDTSVDEVCKTLAKITTDFSGADLAALVRSAAIRSLNENLNRKEVFVNMRHFLEAKRLDFSNASRNKELVSRLNTWRP